MNLFRKVTLSFIIAILVSICIVSLVSNIMINNRFENYLVEEQQTRFDNIYGDINRLYIDESLSFSKMNLMHYSMSEGISLTIEDSRGNVIYSTDNGMGHMNMGTGQGMGMGMGRRNMMGENYPQGDYIEKIYPLLSDGEEIGTLIIGYIDNSYITEGAAIFQDTLTKSLVASGFFAIAIGILISLYLSNSLTKPISKINATANKIRNGNLDAMSTINTNTSEIVELSNSINYLGNTLSKQDKIRKQYASDISHELRTPVTTLKSHLEAMLDGVWDPTDEHLEILMAEVTRLSDLIDNLKDSFIEEEYSMKLNKTDINISKELIAIINIYEPIYRQNGFLIEYNIEDNIHLSLDIDKLKQIMNNLLSNSLRYLRDDGKVLIELKKQKNELFLSVKDNGIGIKGEDLPYVFDRFYRVDTSRNKATGGTGLGLSIVKAFVEAHNGTIDIKSEFGLGTEIIISFPL